MKAIYILLTNTGTFFNQAIKTVTDAPYNHSSISLDKEFRNLYSFGRRKPTNPFWGGFVKEDLVTGTFSWYPSSTCAVYKLKLPKRKFEKVERIIQAFEKKYKNYLYNYIGVLGVPLNRPIQVPASYFCSQFVAEVLTRAGVKLFDKESALVTPDDFRHAPDLQLVYQGRLYDYPFIHSKDNYYPDQYRSFPFRKYVRQQYRKGVWRTDSPYQHTYYFRDGFLKPKKIYLSRKLGKLKRFGKKLMS
ncbi:hypothetical protein [Thalassobacillus hwangdonensis]|uniref:Permuted papain-like amidase enzyme, YaeF/YiiX, C92 family n=1 Tax=Thalassobacillus hwangdonensis TaxID=546108 RepID=A0ABW3L3Z5_9BACI